MSESSAYSLLEMPCLGRPFQLGMLYDCRNDSLIPGVTLWGPDTLGTASSEPMETSGFEVIAEDSLNEKTLHLDVSAGSKLSILSGLVKADGSSKFLYDRTVSKSQARVSLRYKSTSRFEQLNMTQLGKVEYPQVFEDDIATHVVTAVQYGADAVFVFDRQVDSNEKFYQVHGNLEAMISVLPSIDLQVGGSADLDLSKKGIEKIQCKFYGDFILPKNPTTYQDAVRVYQELPKLLGGAGYPNSVPKKVWLYPLSKLDSRVQRMVREISPYLIDDLQEMMESLHELEIRINDLIKSEVCVYFGDLKGDLEKLKRLIGAYKVTIMKKLFTLLPKVRGGGEEETKLAELLEMNRSSPFCFEQISSWISEKEEEIATLCQYLTELDKYPIKLAFLHNEMVELTKKFASKGVLCFDFNISAAGKNVLLQSMEDYFYGRTMDKELESQAPWYESQDMRQRFHRFLRFVNTNSNKESIFVVTNNVSVSKRNTLGIISVFVNGRQTEFEPPDQPCVPLALSITCNNLRLSWAKPKYGSDCVQSYTVSYRSEDDPPDQWRAQTSSEECLVLTKLTPGSLYHFKVRAESAVGSSPESEVGEERLPPDQPGKPEAIKKTYNSLQLRWSKPEHGARTVSSYTVYYRSMNDPPDQWSTDATTEECLTLTKLIPSIQYHIKVRAISGAGLGPESMIAIERLPPGQPGRPQVIEKSHNSVQLQWEKPKLGEHMVQSYSIHYRSVVDRLDQWCIQTSIEESAFLTKLTPGLLYYFKVTAESTEGSSLASELNLVTLPPGEPGKPFPTQITPNAIKMQWAKPKHGAESVKSYIVWYQSVDNLSDQWRSQPTDGTKEYAWLTNLVPNRSYVVKVQAVDFTGEKGPESEPNENPIDNILSPPGKPRAVNITHNGLQLSWDKPAHGAESVQMYTVSYRSINDAEDKWQVCRYSDRNCSVLVRDLVYKMSYVFKVRAETDSGPSPDSELSDFIEMVLLPTPAKSGSVKASSRARSVLRQLHSASRVTYTDLRQLRFDDFVEPAHSSWGAEFFQSRNTLPFYQLPLYCTMNKGFINAVVGSNYPPVQSKTKWSLPVPHKVLMLVGATGAGKSTLINAMANYIMGVDWEDEYRFKLISEEETEHDQSKSQEKCITTYTFHKDKSSLPYTLTVIDTPGFGDTGGLEEIVSQIKEFLSTRSDGGIDQIHGIGFVVQAHLARLTIAQQYVIDFIFSVFGNIFLMVTFADGGRPPVLDAARAAGVPFGRHFTFNNSADNQTNDQLFWSKCKTNFDNFFDWFSRERIQSLQQNKHEQLEVTMQGLKPLIQAGLAKIDELQQEKRLIHDYKAEIIDKSFTYKVQVVKCHKKCEVYYNTNCLKCNYTCHKNCTHISELECSVFDNSVVFEDATCVICPNRCSWKDHTNTLYRFEANLAQETRTSQELKSKYDSALINEIQVEEVITKIDFELNEVTLAILQVIKQAHQIMKCMLRLTPNKPNVLTVFEFIDFLIESEEQEACPGWNERVATLHELRKHIGLANFYLKDVPEEQNLMKLWPIFTETSPLPDKQLLSLPVSITQFDWKYNNAVDKVRIVSVGTQFNYIVPMSENLRGVKVVGEKLFSINGASSQLLEWEEYGFRVHVPAGATSGPCDIAVKAILSGEFEIPEGHQLVSALFAISVSRKLDKPVSVEIEHCVRLENEHDCKYMSFGIAMCNQEVLPYAFEMLDDGIFTPQSKFGKIFRSSFSIIGTFKKLLGIPDSETASSHSNDKEEEVSVLNSTSETAETIDGSASLNSQDTALAELPGSNTPCNQYVASVYLECQASIRTFTWKFVVVQDLRVLDTWLKNNSSFHGEKKIDFKFVFADNCNFLRLKLPYEDDPEPFQGWLIYPDSYPCVITQAEVDEFSDSSPLPCCSVTVLPKAGEDTKEFLRYPVVIENIKCVYSEKKLFIHCSMKQFSTDQAVENRVVNQEAVQRQIAELRTPANLAKLQREPTTADLLLQVGKALNKWRLVGTLLRIDSGRLDAISRENPSSAGDCLNQVFVAWKNSGSSPYTWANIIDVLKTPVVGEIRLASEVEEWVILQP